MLRIQGVDDGAPTRLLAPAIDALDPLVWDIHPGWDSADLTVLPRCTAGHGGPLGCRCHRPARADAWYEVVRSYPRLLTDWEDTRVVQRPFGRVLATLPAPPLRPLAERLAELGEPTLQGWSQAQIEFMGGPEQALELERSRRLQQAEHLTAASWDWEEAARVYLPVLRARLPWQLDAAQLAEVAQARLWVAQNEVEDANKSLDARLRAQPVRPERVQLSRERLEDAEAELAQAHAMVERTGPVPVG